MKCVWLLLAPSAVDSRPTECDVCFDTVFGPLEPKIACVHCGYFVHEVSEMRLEKRMRRLHSPFV